MTTVSTTFDNALVQLPLVAILRGIRPEEVEGIALTLYEQGFRLIEIPLNSPDALNSISRLARCLPDDAIGGAGTVLLPDTVRQLRDAGARLVVTPNTDVTVITAAKQAGMICVPGAVTPSEIFTALHAGADAVKLFPAELVTPSVVKALRAVVPAAHRLLPVGGITPASMAEFHKAGASGFGLGSALYAPGMDSAAVGTRAATFVQAWQQLTGGSPA